MSIGAADIVGSFGNVHVDVVAIGDDTRSRLGMLGVC
jgi:hypothetical protein